MKRKIQRERKKAIREFVEWSAGGKGKGIRVRFRLDVGWGKESLHKALPPGSDREGKKSEVSKGLDVLDRNSEWEPYNIFKQGKGPKEMLSHLMGRIG